MSNLIKDTKLYNEFEVKFKDVLKEVTFSEELRMHNIFKEMNFVPTLKTDKNKPKPVHYHNQLYQEYRLWLMKNGYL